MDFTFTDDQELLRSSLRDFLRSYCTKEWIDGIEEKGEFPQDLWDRFAEMGLYGLVVPEEYGGAGAGMMEAVIVSEELGRVAGSVVQVYHPSAIFAGLVLLKAGTELKERFLPRMAAGGIKLAFALSEPSA